MNTTNHTPGPWKAERMTFGPKEKDRRSGFVVNGPETPENAATLPERICDMRVPAGVYGYAEGMGNALLIASAPELLAACKVALLAFDTMIQHEESRPYCDPGQMVKLRAAIWKAEGRKET